MLSKDFLALKSWNVLKILVSNGSCLAYWDLGHTWLGVPFRQYWKLEAHLTIMCSTRPANGQQQSPYHRHWDLGKTRPQTLLESGSPSYNYSVFYHTRHIANGQKQSPCHRHWDLGQTSLDPSEEGQRWYSCVSVCVCTRGAIPCPNCFQTLISSSLCL